MTVTYLSPRRVCRHTCSSTPITFTPLNRRGSPISTRRPSASTHRWPCSTKPREPQRSWPRSGVGRPARSTPTAGRRETTGPSAPLHRQALAPHQSAPIAAEPAHRDQQDRRSPSERFVRQPTGGGIPRPAGLPPPPTRLVTVDNPTCQHRPVRLQELTGHEQTERVQPGDVVRSGVAKEESAMSRASGRTVWELPSSEDLDPYPRSDPPTPTTTSTAKSPLGAAAETRVGPC
jgi:hypothetical protein